MENLEHQIEEKRKSGELADKKAKESLGKAKDWAWEAWAWFKEFISWAGKQLRAVLWSGVDKIHEKTYQSKLKREGISEEEKKRYMEQMKKYADRSKTRALKSKVYWKETKSWWRRTLKWWVRAVWYWLKSGYHKLDKMDSERWAKKLVKQGEMRETRRKNAKAENAEGEGAKTEK